MDSVALGFAYGWTFASMMNGMKLALGGYRLYIPENASPTEHVVRHAVYVALGPLGHIVMLIEPVKSAWME